jgi:hypothetical protein
VIGRPRDPPLANFLMKISREFKKSGKNPK